MAGASRSATIMIAYLMYKKNLRLGESFQTVKKIRSLISPNGTFKKELKAYQELIDGNKIDQVNIMNNNQLMTNKNTFNIIEYYTPTNDLKFFNIKSNQKITDSNKFLYTFDVPSNQLNKNENSKGFFGISNFVDQENVKIDFN
jgi:hypothetical protein